MELFPRELLVHLYFAGGSPELALLQGPTKTEIREIDVPGTSSTATQEVKVPIYSYKRYQEALHSEEYALLSKELKESFTENVDGLLLGNLYRAQRDLQYVGPDGDNYGHIARHFREMFKMSSPIVERLATKRIELDNFQGLELFIPGTEPDDLTPENNATTDD